jgi:hypothetical protein
MNPDPSYVVPFICDGEDFGTGRFSIIIENDYVRLDLELGDETFSAECSDCFEAFCEIRRGLENRQIYPLCAGATQNVFPSGMSRSMGGGLMGYRLSLGKQALREDLVNIFDEVEASRLAKVEEQESFFEDWIKSLGN